MLNYAEDTFFLEIVNSQSLMLKSADTAGCS